MPHLKVPRVELGAPKAIEANARIVTVRAPAETITRHRLPYFVGISRGTVGATGLSMHMVLIPPGAAAEPHLHRGYETAIYVLEGRVEIR